MPHSNQSHIGWGMLLAHQPAGLNNSTVSYITSTGWVRWLKCYSYISSLFKSLSLSHTQRILFLFFSHFFSEAAIKWPRITEQKSHHNCLRPALSITVSLQHLVLLLTTLFWCSNWLYSLFPFLRLSSNFYQIFFPGLTQNSFVLIFPITEVTYNLIFLHELVISTSQKTAVFFWLLITYHFPKLFFSQKN